MSKYRQVGGRLAAYIRTNNPSTQQIQGLLADLLAGDELRHTMREVVSRASFHSLQALAGSGGGAVERDALLQELANRYLPSVVDEVGQLINGLLDQPAGKTLYGSDLIDHDRNTPKINTDQEKAIAEMRAMYEEVRQELNQLKLANEISKKSEEAAGRNQERSRKPQPYRIQMTPQYLEARLEDLQMDAERQWEKKKRTSLGDQYDPAYNYIRQSGNIRRGTGIDPSYDPAYEYINRPQGARGGYLFFAAVLLFFVLFVLVLAGSI